jgi:Inner membrane protein YgaP-like, transmembrane domain
MKTNVGKQERLIRLAVGFVLCFSGLIWIGVMVWVGLVVIVTALIAWCPISGLLGLSTAGGEDTDLAPDTSGPRADAFERHRRLK